MSLYGERPSQPLPPQTVSSDDPFVRLGFGVEKQCSNRSLPAGACFMLRTRSRFWFCGSFHAAIWARQGGPRAKFDCCSEDHGAAARLWTPAVAALFFRTLTHYRLQPKYCRLQTKNYLLTTNYRLPTRNYRLKTTHYRMQHRLHTTDHRLQSTEYTLNTTQYRPQTTDYTLQTAD